MTSGDGKGPSSDLEAVREKDKEEIDKLFGDSDDEDEEQAAPPVAERVAGGEGAKPSGDDGYEESEDGTDVGDPNEVADDGDDDEVEPKKRQKVLTIGSEDAKAAVLALEAYRCAPPPMSLKKKDMRCCMICKLIKTREQFYEMGCDNCESFLRLKGDMENVNEFTTANFEGMLASTNPSISWAAKWLRLRKSVVAGCYAIECRDKLTDRMKSDLREKGVRI